ncbi:MAG: hypothetical protein U9P90_03120 [Patescibacteria group bacterium]|nr:hypothetical protein [Patescibacteria group bacterium]
MSKKESESKSIILFEDVPVRRTWVEKEEKWYFAVVDIIKILAESKDPVGYIKDMRRRDKELSKGWGQIATPLVILGGEILKAEISKKPLKTHFWNRIDGKEHDFTIAQFPKDFKMPKGEKISIKEAKSAPQIQKTFPILLKRVKKYL